ncbi:hypothetical protein J2Y69_002876 [Microbacterium resistens]|uniref:DUF3099 domain-containing protein n=1 Tax=Microbacterium resistens TaxID=156977 RepID=A0ABU1SFB1_9MICO|nr:DUF3099 domain-containing protein [Microbacterium resistens]MDR6868262.1 hypothetical protein [Microbacterium resistens]
MRKTANAPSVTSLPRAPRDEATSRVRQYMITMGIRVACFVLMVVITPYGWYTWVFGIAAAVLPYIAVVFANAGDDSVPTRAESPRLELTADTTIPAESTSAQPTITLHESESSERPPGPVSAS